MAILNLAFDMAPNAEEQLDSLKAAYNASPAASSDKVDKMFCTFLGRAVYVPYRPGLVSDTFQSRFGGIVFML